MRSVLFILIILSSLTSISCGKHSTSASSSFLSQDIDNDNFSDDNGSSPTLSFKPDICSDLEFNYVSWPTGTNQATATVFGLAMNMSGSFEGHDGWDNISNNFDGQGVSLGLFNQNLGQGSLQTLMLQLLKNSEPRMKSFFTAHQFNLVAGMLKGWNGGSLMSKATKDPLDIYNNPISELDDPALIEGGESEIAHQKASSNRNQVSVNWAVQNLYSGNKFKAEWKNSLQEMSRSGDYVSIQVQAAKNIHNRAINYMQKYGFKELRAYLFFFDIVVQNGSLTSAIESKFATWLKTNSTASETTKLKKLLEYRLTIVKAAYVNDVRARKTAIIDGVGTVHGSKRDFRKEYCAPAWSSLFVHRPTLK